MLLTDLSVFSVSFFLFLFILGLLTRHASIFHFFSPSFFTFFPSLSRRWQ